MRAALALLLLVAQAAHGGTASVLCVCDQARFRGRGGDLLVTCPNGREQVRFLKPCDGKTLRLFYRGDEVRMTCGSQVNPFLHPLPSPVQRFDALCARPTSGGR